MTDIEDGTYTAVVDRFESTLAVLIVEGEDGPVGELVVDEEQIPSDGRQVDAVLSVTVADGALSEATYQHEETGERADASQRRFDRLSRRLGNDNSSDNGN